MSARGRCLACWTANQDDNIRQLAAHRGPYFKHWRQQIAASVGGVLLDDVTAGD
jgi:hypothetical protein